MGCQNQHLVILLSCPSGHERAVIIHSFYLEFVIYDPGNFILQTQVHTYYELCLLVYFPFKLPGALLSSHCNFTILSHQVIFQDYKLSGKPTK